MKILTPNEQAYYQIKQCLAFELRRRKRHSATAEQITEINDALKNLELLATTAGARTDSPPVIYAQPALFE